MGTKHVVFSHSWTEDLEFSWYPRARDELKNAGFEVTIATFPDSPTLRMDKWVSALAKAVGHPTTDTILVGHSIGCANIMRYLETLEEWQQIGGVVFTAGFTDDLGLGELESFFESPFDFPKIRRCGRQFISIHSDNDPVVRPDYLKHALIFLEALRAKLIIIPDAGHFSPAENWHSHPEVVRQVLEISQNI